MEAALPSRAKSLSPWLIWGAAALFYCYQFMLRVMPSFISDDLMSTFAVDACSLGVLTGFYYYTYSALQLPLGVVIDKLKPRRTISGAIVICTIGCIIFATAPCLAMAALGRAIIGAGSAAALLSCLKLANIWFPPNKLPLVVGLTFLLGSSGALFAGLPLAFLLDIMDWRSATLLLSSVGAVLFVLCWLTIKDVNADVVDQGTPATTPSFSTLLSVIRNPQGWWTALYGGLMYLPLSGFADLWAAPYIKTTYQADVATAGFGVGAFYLGIGIGAPLYATISSKFQSFTKVMQASALLSLLFFCLAVYLPTLPFALFLCTLFCCGLSLSGQFLAYTVACRINPAQAEGSACGFHNAMCMISGVIAQPLMGWILDLLWNGHMVEGVRHFLPSNYQMAFAVIPLALLASYFVAGRIRETYTA